ncbi:hypothetical protein MKW94_028006 [Papaver nudicaule]|uniref:Uncharacterized protein n=1 Tax=Papaver nudicaule TaxID=74823 RepID=A0AA41V1R3_PAPNU|nr:hypothetical protein [Papaver nudicaule]
MASKPGIITEWPWKRLGKFKGYTTYCWLHLCWIVSPLFFEDDSTKWDWSYFLTSPFLFWKVIHNQLRISYSRFRTSKSKNKILDKPIDFNQVDIENN